MRSRIAVNKKCGIALWRSRPSRRKSPDWEMRASFKLVSLEELGG